MPAPLAVQMYSLREALEADFTGVTKKLADIGYKFVEPWASMPLAHSEAAKLFADLGLGVISAHMPLPLGDAQASTLEAAAIYGLKYLIVPYMPREQFTTVDGIKAVCDQLNEANKVVTGAGMTLGYHNHEFEYEMVDGSPAYHIMLEHLDPGIILEVDTYWVQVGGQDAARIIAELGTRAPLLHIKDGPADDPAAAMVAAGEGNMDIPAIVKAGEAHTELLVVELDRCDTDMMTAIDKSYQYMTKEGLADGSR